MAGKPHKMTAEMIEKLKAAFANGFNDEEAALYCWVSPRAIYDYCSKNPDFAELKELLKRKPAMKAKLNIVWSINRWDLTDSKWYAERKSRDEFSLKQEIEQKGEMTLIHKNISKEEAEAMSEYERNERRKEIINGSNK